MMSSLWWVWRMITKSAHWVRDIRMSCWVREIINEYNISSQSRCGPPLFANSMSPRKRTNSMSHLNFHELGEPSKFHELNASFEYRTHSGRFHEFKQLSKSRELNESFEYLTRRKCVHDLNEFSKFHQRNESSQTHALKESFGEVGGWGRDPFSRNFMKPTPRRKWYLTTGRRFH